MTDREEFEVFVKSRGRSVVKRGGRYIESMTRLWWDCWQAARTDNNWFGETGKPCTISNHTTPRTGGEVEAVEFTDYDCGAINDYGGGNVGWWQDYIRAEVERANDFWREQVEPDPLYTHPPQAAKVPDGFSVERRPDCIVVTRHSDMGAAAYSPDSGLLIEVMGWHFLDALLTAAPQPVGESDYKMIEEKIMADRIVKIRRCIEEETAPVISKFEGVDLAPPEGGR